MNLRPGAAKTLSLALEPGAAVEVTVAQFWSSPGEGTPHRLAVDFRGVGVAPSALALVGGGLGGAAAQGANRVVFSAALRDEELAPAVALDRWRRPLHPARAAVRSLGARDVLPSGRQCFALELEYAFSTAEDGVEVTPRAPKLNG